MDGRALLGSGRGGGPLICMPFSLKIKSYLALALSAIKGNDVKNKHGSSWGGGCSILTVEAAVLMCLFL